MKPEALHSEGSYLPQSPVLLLIIIKNFVSCLDPANIPRPTEMVAGKESSGFVQSLNAALLNFHGTNPSSTFIHETSS